MDFTPSNTITNINSTTVETRTYRLLQELNDIESDPQRNQGTLDNVSSERDEQTGAITATVILPCLVSLQGGELTLNIINPYQVTENVNVAFFESAFTQWLAEQDTTKNPTQTKYITVTQTFVPRQSPETGGSNATITFNLTGLPTTKEISGDYIAIKGAVYLQ